MTNRYIKIKMEPTKSGIGGSFTTKASFQLDNIKAKFTNVDVKIDTGCSVSTVPLSRFKALDQFCEELKKQDICNNVPYQRSYGVESGGQRHTEPISFEEKMKCSALKFQHGVSEFSIGGVDIPTNQIHLNYNRKGNILIGMDILKDLDIHIGTTRDGETLFLACPRGQINKEYLRERNRLFRF